jgi:hypothetical protein
VSKIFCFRKKEFGTSVACFMANEYRDNLNVHLLLRNTLYKWTHNLSAVPELTQAATPLFQLKPPFNIAPFLTEFALLSLLLRSTCRVSPSLCSLDTTPLACTKAVIRYCTHTAFSFGGRCSSVRPGRFGVRNPTGMKFAAPIQTGPEAQPTPRSSLPPVQCVQWVYFLRVKQPGRGLDHPPPSSSVVTENVELYPTFFPPPACLHCFLYSELYFYFLFPFRRKLRRILNVGLLLRK